MWIGENEVQFLEKELRVHKKEKKPVLSEKQQKDLEKLGYKRRVEKWLNTAKTIWKNIQLKQSISSNIKSADLTDSKFDDMNSDKEFFNKNYSKYNEAICGWLWLNTNLSKSVIERESCYDKNKQSETWADWFMQLTHDPFDDMHKWVFFREKELSGRHDGYLSYFTTLPENLIAPIKNLSVRKTLNDLKKLSLNPKYINQKNWNQKIEFLQNNRTEPHLNLIIWNMYLCYLKNKEPSDEKIDNQVKILEKLIHKMRSKKWVKEKLEWKLEKRFKALLGEKWIEVSNWVKELEELLLKLKNENNKDLRSSFYALSRYNWQWYSKQDLTFHKIIYAAVVLTAKKWRDFRTIS